MRFIRNKSKHSIEPWSAPALILAQGEHSCLKNSYFSKIFYKKICSWIFPLSHNLLKASDMLRNTVLTSCLSSKLENILCVMSVVDWHRNRQALNQNDFLIWVWNANKISPKALPFQFEHLKQKETNVSFMDCDRIIFL